MRIYEYPSKVVIDEYNFLEMVREYVANRTGRHIQGKPYVASSNISMLGEINGLMIECNLLPIEQTPKQAQGRTTEKMLCKEIEELRANSSVLEAKLRLHDAYFQGTGYRPLVEKIEKLEKHNKELIALCNAQDLRQEIIAALEVKYKELEIKYNLLLQGQMSFTFQVQLMSMGIAHSEMTVTQIGTSVTDAWSKVLRVPPWSPGLVASIISIN